MDWNGEQATVNKVRIAVVGVGLGGKTHIKYLHRSNQAILDAIIAPDRQSNHQAALNEGVPIFHSIDECIEQRRPDGIIIASPNKLHAVQTRSCIDAGIPVLLEKPITSNAEEGAVLVELAERSTAKILVGHHRAHNPIIRTIINVIKQGRLGTLVSVTGSAQFHKPAHYFEDGPWRKEYGGGPILINLIHEIDNLRRLVGEISQVQAITSTKIRGFAVEDTAAINFVFENGALGSFMLSDTTSTARSWEQTTGENPAFPNYPDEDCYLIAGTQGSIAIPTMRMKYYPEGIDPSWWTPYAEEVLELHRDDPLDLQLEHFVDVILGNAEPLVTARDGYRNLLIAEAIKRSALTKTLVDVSE